MPFIKFSTSFVFLSSYFMRSCATLVSSNILLVTLTKLTRNVEQLTKNSRHSKINKQNKVDT